MGHTVTGDGLYAEGLDAVLLAADLSFNFRLQVGVQAARSLGNVIFCALAQGRDTCGHSPFQSLFLGCFVKRPLCFQVVHIGLERGLYGVGYRVSDLQKDGAGGLYRSQLADGVGDDAAYTYDGGGGSYGRPAAPVWTGATATTS